MKPYNGIHIESEVKAMTINTRRIEAIMAETGLTKKALAESCGISAQNVSTIIRRGTCEPRTAGKLAFGLGIPIEEIMAQREAT